jgi:hypothetical protein
VLFICCKFFWVDFLLIFPKHFEYYRVLININLIILYFFKIYILKIFLNNYRRNYTRFVSEGITDEMKYFFARCFSVNSSVIIFFYYQRIYWWIKNYQWKIHRRRLSVGDFVDNFFTNEMVVQISTKNSVDKSNDCGSEQHIMIL